MIVYEITEETHDVVKARQAVLEALTPMHLIYAYKDLDDLRAFLDKGLEDMRQARATGQIPEDMPIALTRCWLFFRNRDAVDIVKVRMAGTGEFNQWPIPDGWFGFYRQIESLRAMARRYDPQIVFIH